jgi:hypothetical protein
MAGIRHPRRLRVQFEELMTPERHGGINFTQKATTLNQRTSLGILNTMIGLSVLSLGLQRITRRKNGILLDMGTLYMMNSLTNSNQIWHLNSCRV